MGVAKARRQGVLVGLATGAYGLSFGALAVTAGLNIWQAVALSLLMFTGSSQFAFLGVFATGGSPAAAVATAGLVGIRHASYGALLARALRPMRGVRLALAAQLTLDESAAIALARHHRKSERAGFWAADVTVYLMWNATTLVGALAGDRIGDPNAWGLDAAAAAAFLGLLWGHLSTKRGRVIAVLAAGVALALTPWLPSGVPLLAAAAVAVLAGGWGRR